MADVEGKESAAGPPARSGAAGALTLRPERHCVAPPGRLCPRSPPGPRKTLKENALRSKQRKCCGNAHMRDENDVENCLRQHEASISYQREELPVCWARDLTRVHVGAF